MIDVSCKVAIVELNDENISTPQSLTPQSPHLHVKSHWSNPDRVVIQIKGIAEFPEGTTITVMAKDLQLAIDNASNTRRF